MKRFFIVVMVLTICSANLYSQGRKDVRDAGIKKVTEYKYEYKTGKEVKILNAVTTYDGSGNETEVTEYDDFGKVTKHEKYTYNDNNDKASVTEYDPAGKVRKVTKYTYDANGKKATESEYDGAAKLKKLSKYSYFGKFKTEKLTYDPNNKLIQKKTYIYDK